MQWGQIKTLLILSFLILDIYLFAQFLEKKEQADLTIMEHEPSTIEEQLKAESITVEELPEKTEEETYISVQQKLFTDEELENYDVKVDQETYLLDQYFIVSQLEESIPIKKDATIEDITQVFQDVVYYADEYEFWNWNEDLNIIIFFQKKLDRPVYYNQNGLALLFLNDNNEVTYYIQTMLGETETIAEKGKLIEPIRAIETLYISNELHPGDHVTNVKIGFYTRVPFEGDVQVFAPIWKVNVNNEKHFFVNAIEGFTFSTNEHDFLLEFIDAAINKLQVQLTKSTAIEDVLNDLKQLR